MLAIFLLFFFPLAAFSSYNVGCMKIYDGGMQPNGQQVIRIFNGCPEKMMVNACVLTDNGKTKLYSSGRTVPVAGNFTLYTFPFDRPVKIDATYSPFAPPVPQMCLSKKSIKEIAFLAQVIL